MLPLETLGAFFVTAIVMGLAPGPDNIFVLTQSALYGFRAGIMTTLGLMTGLFGHTAAVAPRRCGTVSDIRNGLYGPEMCRGGLPAVSGMAFFP